MPLKTNIAKDIPKTSDDACPKCGGLDSRIDMTADHHLIFVCHSCGYAVFLN